LYVHGYHYYEAVPRISISSDEPNPDFLDELISLAVLLDLWALASMAFFAWPMGDSGTLLGILFQGRAWLLYTAYGKLIP
jgi:hypothetical protein